MQDDFYAYVMKGRWRSFKGSPGDLQVSQMTMMQHEVYRTLRSMGRTSNPFCQTMHSPMRKARQAMRADCALAEWLLRMRQTKDRLSLVDRIRELHEMGSKVFFQLSYDPDLRTGLTGRYVPFLRIDEPIFDGPERASFKFLKALFKAFSVPEPRTSVIRFEAELFQARPKSFKLQNPKETWNPVEPANPQDRHLAWVRFYTQAPLVSLDNVAFFKRLGRLMETASLKRWRDYLTFRALLAWSGLFSDTYKLWNRCFYPRLDSPTRADHQTRLGSQAWWQSACRFYCAAPLEGKEDVSRLVDRIRGALELTFQQADLCPESRAEALAKLARMEILEGFTHTDFYWRADSGVGAPHFFDEWIQTGYWAQYRWLQSKDGAEVDRTMWRFVACTEENAFYSREMNAVYLPRALFMSPLFEPGNDALNYGALGSIVAHELLHAFDFDSQPLTSRGTLGTAWCDRDLKRYQAESKRMVRLFERKRSIGWAEDGRTTLSENIADWLALEVVWLAFGADINDFVRARAFFVAFVVSQAQRYRNKAVEREMGRDDPHALARTRVNVPLSMFDPFLRLYHVGPGDPMFTPVKDRPRFFRSSEAKSERQA